MSERSGTITFKGNLMTLVGEVTQEPDYEADIAAAKAFL